MLVTFKTNAYSDITMFGEPAVSLLKLMGQSGNVPGAVMAEDIPAALASLRQGLASLSAADRDGAESSDVASSGLDNGSDDPPPVALHKRAGPLIELLEAASASGDNVLWDQ